MCLFYMIFTNGLSLVNCCQSIYEIYDFESSKRRPQVNTASEMLELKTPRLLMSGEVLFKSRRTQSSLASRDIAAFEIRTISRPSSTVYKTPEKGLVILCA